VSERPECRTTIFDIGHDQVDPNFPLPLADPIPVGDGFNLSGLKIPFFEPEPRNKFFEMGAFTPLRATSLNVETSSLTIPPGMILNGSAISYLKPEADLIAVRPKLVDPILAYMPAGNGMVGVLTGELSPELLADPIARQSVKDWLLQTVNYSARNRYSFQITDLGNAINLCITVHINGNKVPNLDKLSAGMNWPGGTEAMVLERSEVDQAEFCGVARLPDDGNTHEGFLTITESGPDALGRSQRIPMLIPGASSASTALTQEDYSNGINRPLLQQMASVGGGVLLPASDVSLFHPQLDTPTSRAIWPWLIVSGLFFYLAAIACQRVNQ
jgi:hypothetical protein